MPVTLPAMKDAFAYWEVMEMPALEGAYASRVQHLYDVLATNLGDGMPPVEALARFEKGRELARQALNLAADRDTPVADASSE